MGVFNRVGGGESSTTEKCSVCVASSSTLVTNDN